MNRFLNHLSKKMLALTVCAVVILTLVVGINMWTRTRQSYDIRSNKIDERILETMDNGYAVVVVKLRRSFSSGYGHTSFNILSSVAEETIKKSEIASFLEERGEILNVFWLGGYILANVSVDILHTLATMDEVERIFPNFQVKILNFTEREVTALSGLDGVTWGLNRIGAPEVWSMGYNGSGILVCVIDTGLDIDHPDIKGKLWTDNPSDDTYPGGWIEFDKYGNIVRGSKPHDTHGHGTHVSGTIAGGNASGISIGVAPGVKLMHALALPGGSGTFAQCIAAMQWAIAPFDQYGNPAGRHADIVSMSWGAEGYYKEFIEPIDEMRKMGVIPVVAIGNGGEESSCCPGNVYGAFAIGAVDEYDNVALFSGGEVVDWSDCYSEPYIKPDFSAPGVDIYSSLPDGSYDYWSGTSMATPHVAGAIALMLQCNPNLTVDDVYFFLKIAAEDKGDAGKDIRYGWGIVNAYASVGLVSSHCGIRGYVLGNESLSPPKWGGRLIVSGTLSREIELNNEGYYRMALIPGNYTIQVEAFGYYAREFDFELRQNEWIELNITLQHKPYGKIEGKVADIKTGDFVVNASLALVDTPIRAFTDEEGYYVIEDVPVGNYSLDVWAWGYMPKIIYNITVLANETIVIDVELSPTIKVAVIGDYEHQIVDLLMRNISAVEVSWDDILVNIDQYDVVIISAPDTDPGESKFISLIQKADQYRVGLIFTNSIPGTWHPFGISLLFKYLGDPNGTLSSSFYDGTYYVVKLHHPILNGWKIGDKIHIINGPAAYAWFCDYSGVTIAELGTDHYGVVGCGIAYSIRPSGNVHVLLSALAPVEDANIKDDWTEDAKKIFVNAVRWAGQTHVFNPKISLDPQITTDSNYVRVNGSGFAPLQKITVFLNGTEVLETFSDYNGNFEGFFKLAVAKHGSYLVEAIDDYGNSAEAKLKVLDDLKSFSLQPGWNLVSLSSAYPVRVEDLTVYYQGELFSWTEASSNEIVLGYVYWWNGTYVIVDMLEPNKGYWIYAYEQCEVYWQTP